MGAVWECSSRGGATPSRSCQATSASGASKGMAMGTAGAPSSRTDATIAHCQESEAGRRRSSSRAPAAKSGGKSGAK